ncbi:MAG TPA: hypothetical protein V6C58_09585 [Allocoleopsis sp.]
MLQPDTIVKKIRSKLKEYNYYPDSNGTSILKAGIYRRKFDEWNDWKARRIDSQYRKYNAFHSGIKLYSLPKIRTVDNYTLDEILLSPIQNAITQVILTQQNISNGLSPLESIIIPSQNLQQLLFLYSTFKSLSNPIVKKVEGYAEIETTLIFIGEVILSETELHTIYISTFLTNS